MIGIGEGIFRSKRDIHYGQSSTEEHVGPGTYQSGQYKNINTFNLKNVGFLSEEKRFSPSFNQNPQPGPGQYNYKFDTNKSMASVSFSSNVERIHFHAISQDIEGPGPGSYNVYEAGKSVDSAPKIKTSPRFKSTTKAPVGVPSIPYKRAKQKSVSLGPGSYDPKFEAIKSKSPTSIMFKEKRNLNALNYDENLVNPIYKFLKEFKNKSEEVKRAKKEGGRMKKMGFLANATKDKSFGSYNEDFLEQSTCIFKSTTKKTDLMTTNDNPGPGSYDYKFSFFQTPDNNSLAKTFATAKKDTNYMANNSFIYKTKEDYVPPVGSYQTTPKPVPGHQPSASFVSKFERDCMKKIGKSAHPGPGTYTCDINKRSPFIMEFHKKTPFGSTCPRFQGKSQATPVAANLGPGSYDPNHSVHSQRSLSVDKTKEKSSTSPGILKRPPPISKSRQGGTSMITEPPNFLIGISEEDFDMQNTYTSKYGTHQSTTGNLEGTSFHHKLQSITANESPSEIKSMIQNVVNNINGIAFGGHCERFKAPQLSPIPGPASYNLIQEEMKKNRPNFAKEARFKSQLLEVNPTKKPIGPGAYFKDSSLIKNSFNVTMPNNILIKRREDLLKEKITKNLNS